MNPKRKQLLTSTGQSLEKISRIFGINLSSYLGRLYSFGLLVLFFLFMSWHNVCIDYCARHIVKKFMILLQYILYVLLVLTMIITSLFRPKQFAFPRQEMFIIDSILESYGAQFSDKDIFIMKHMQNIATLTISLFVTLKFFYEIIAIDLNELIWFFIISWYSMICLLVMDGLFSHYVNDIYLRFRELNKIMIQHSKDNLSISYIDFTTTDTCNKRNGLVISKLRSIQHIHHVLTILAMKVNENFSLQLLINSAINLNAIILYLYQIYYDITTVHNDQGVDIFHVIFKFFFIFCNILLSVYISYVCQRTINESQRMTKILHEVFLKHKSLRSEVVYFSLQLVHREFVFTACGLYDINIPLLCSIAGAVVTYLVMVIQLDSTTKFAIVNTNQSYVGNSSIQV